MSNTGFKPVLIIVLLFLTACSSQGYTRQPSYDEGFSDAELDQMLAPIALYPDPLLSQILMAATYPEEVRDAARWSIEYPGLEGQDAANAVAHMPWDPSVKALVAFPQVLSRMDADSLWTQRLGDAYLMQEGDVLDAIQRLRARAHAAGNLDNLDHVQIHREQHYIYIEPRDPRVIYVPYYHPLQVYSTWWWPDYPPHYWGAPPGYHSGIYFYWGRGFHVAPVFFFSTFHWHNRHIVVYDSRRYRSPIAYRSYHRYEGTQRWRHNPAHRHGVRYPHKVSHHYSRDAYPRSGYRSGAYSGRDARSESYSQRGAPRLPHRQDSAYPSRDNSQQWRNNRGRDSNNHDQRGDWRRDSGENPRGAYSDNNLQNPTPGLRRENERSAASGRQPEQALPRQSRQEHSQPRRYESRVQESRRQAPPSDARNRPNSGMRSFNTQNQADNNLRGSRGNPVQNRTNLSSQGDRGNREAGFNRVPRSSFSTQGSRESVGTPQRGRTEGSTRSFRGNDSPRGRDGFGGRSQLQR